MRLKAPATICLAAAVAFATVTPAAAACRTAETGAKVGVVTGIVTASMACGPLFFVCAGITTLVSSTLGSGVGTMIDRGIRDCDEVTTEIAVHSTTSGRLDRPTPRAGRPSQVQTQEHTVPVLVPPLYTADAAGEGSADPVMELMVRIPWELADSLEFGLPDSESYNPHVAYWRLPLSQAQLARVLLRSGRPPVRPAPPPGRSLQTPLPRGKSNDLLPMGRAQLRGARENGMRPPTPPTLPRGKSNDLLPVGKSQLQGLRENAMHPQKRLLPRHDPGNLRDPRTWQDTPSGTDDTGALQRQEDRRRQMR